MVEETLEKAAKLIRGGGVVAFPTETFYGLAVDPAQERPLRRLLDIKKRDAAKGIPVIAASFEAVSSHFEVPPALAECLEAIWPAALSVALRPLQAVSKSLCGQHDTVAVRVSDDPFARRLAHLSGGLITATSANLSGQPPTRNADDVLAQLEGAVDLILGSGETPGGQPSTIVAMEKGGLRIYRRGDFDPNLLSEMTGLSCLP